MSDQESGCPCASFSVLTHAAAVLGALFILFMFFETTTIRWWIMLPLAAVSFWLFAIQRGQTTGFEQTVCRWGTWIVAIAAILRDMCLSGQLVALYQRLQSAGITLHV
jgi:hypothetical protein